ncbi:DUF2194 domain-containing protein [Halobacillus litoralis]|uniref:DUF2194 domain-containing protein n=1 Tax=Halobacillus litoralis TaxID=45668 RepID=UPI001CD1D2A8|nr:DUF2194 domain-containing protein [Halobacillus litoralis]MCA0972052.1 DUF2194 domain-containing protein [Halobacillus litoralis]
MKKQTIQLSLFLFILLIGMVALLQLVRVEQFHRWLSAQASPNLEVETMTAEKTTAEGEELMIYIHQNDSALSEGAIENLTYSLDYAKVPHQAITVEEIESLEPSPYSVLVLAGEHSREWPKEAVSRFVEQGGRLFIAGRFINPEWNDLIGLTDVEDFKDDIFGITFEQELFPGYIDLPSSSTLFSHSIADVTLSENAEVYLRTEGEPLMWTHRFGEGKVLFWNTTTVADKNSRGLLLQSMSLLPPTFVSAQAAIKVMHIDDFPAPVPFNTSAEFEAEYGMSVKDFYSHVWWEDMRELGEKYDFTYTGYMIGTYRDDTELEGEPLLDVSRFPMLYFGRKLLKNGGEIGLHGYNHQSLVTADEPIDPGLGYRPWEDQEQMVKALKDVQKSFSYYFPEEELKTYVPPSNVLNRTGINALHEALPEMGTIAGLYIGGETGSFVQEYEFDEVYPDLYHFPRITSGYIDEMDDPFLQTDAIANMGVFAHFIHPDDVLDSYRSLGKNWTGMRDKLGEIGEHIQSNYPYLEAMTQSNATKKMVQYQQSELDVFYREGDIVIKGEGIVEPSHLFIRVEEGKSIDTGEFSFGKVESYGDRLYLLTLTEPEATIEVKGEES